MNKKLLLYGGSCVTVFSIALVVVGEFDTLIAWWLTLILLFPPMLFAFKLHYVAPITISVLTFVTQSITLPFFYLNRDNFAWSHVKPYQFTGLEVLPILLKVFFFLILLNLLFVIFYKFTFIGGSPSKIVNLSNKATSLLTAGLKSRFQLSNRIVGGIYTVILLFFVASLTWLNLWMFSQGISIVGVEPPALPYRLAGILHYFTKYIAVFILAYIYFKTRRGWLPMSLMLGYSWILGLSSLSRSSLMFVVLPVMFFAWLDHRKLMLIVVAFLSTIGYSVVTYARDFVYIVVDGKVGATLDLDIMQILFYIISSSEIELFSIEAIVIQFIHILNRIESFENLVMSEFYDSYQVDGPLAILIRMIFQPLFPIDLDAHHIQWQGHTLPEGFVNGGGLLSTVVILGNAGWWWIALSAILAAVTLVILEKSVRRLDGKYQLQNLLTTAVVGFLSIIYFTGGSGSIFFMYALIILFIASFLPSNILVLRRKIPYQT